MHKTKSITDHSEDAVDFATVLSEELHEIGRLRAKREWSATDTASGGDANQSQWDTPCTKTEAALGADTGPPPDAEGLAADEVFASAHNQELVGLAFSGGGIRSATFNLGVLQGLADRGLLPMFDYLSTVSGGGYIGSWLETWIYRGGQEKRVAQCSPEVSSLSPIRRVQQCLKTDRSGKREHGEPWAVRFLREYSNYLTPRLGFLGADTWTAVGIYLRNLLLNQSVLILFLLLLLLLPYIAVWASWSGDSTPSDFARLAAPVLVIALIVVALTTVSVNMVHLTGKYGKFRFFARQGWILVLVVAPLFLSAWFLSVAVWRYTLWNWSMAEWVKRGAIVFFFVWTVTTLFGPESEPAENGWNSLKNKFVSIVFSPLSGAVAGVLLWVFATELLQRWNKTDGIWHVVSFGPPLAVLIFLVVGTLQLGLIGRIFPDFRREWWGRLAGWLLISSIIWATAFALAIYSPQIVMWARRRWVSTATLVWLVNTAIGVFGGKSENTGSLNSPSWKDRLLSATPYIAILGLVVTLATVLKAILAVVNGWPVAAALFAEDKSDAHTHISAHWDILWTVRNSNLLLVVLVLALACLILAWRVDLNEFSMNLFYRNRLVRCYLGASHKCRTPNPFTGFDPGDDVLVSKLRAENCYSGPLPIINTTLNLVKGRKLAWQERKGESFVITPLRCGFDTWLEQLDRAEDEEDCKRDRERPSHIQEYGFRRADKYAYRDGFRLGTAVSISGAAASPNMGYHSAASLAFLMTFFNVRLGFWSGNPRHDKTWTLPGPVFGLFHLLAELFGLTDDDARYVYLSD